MKTFFVKIKKLFTDPTATVWNTFGKAATPPTPTPPPTTRSTTPPLTGSARNAIRRILKLIIPLVILGALLKYMGYDETVGNALFWIGFTFLNLIAGLIVWAKTGKWKKALGWFLSIEAAILLLPWVWAQLVYAVHHIPWATVKTYTLYGLGALVLVAVFFFLLKKGKGPDIGDLGPKVGKLLMVALILGALVAGPLVWGGVMTHRNIWNDIRGSSIAMCAILLLLLPAIGFAFMGKGAKIASAIVAFMIYGIIWSVIYQNVSAEELIRRQNAPPPTATQKRWTLAHIGVDPYTKRPRPQDGYSYYPARLTQWNDHVWAMEMAFVENGLPVEGFMYWDKQENPSCGYWYRRGGRDDRRQGKWTLRLVGPDAYIGEMTCEAGCHTYNIKLSALP